jgi:hypothetical protein
LPNDVTGKDKSNDVISGLDGNDHLRGGSGTPVTRWRGQRHFVAEPAATGEGNRNDVTRRDSAGDVVAEGLSIR